MIKINQLENNETNDLKNYDDKRYWFKIGNGHRAEFVYREGKIINNSLNEFRYSNGIVQPKDFIFHWSGLVSYFGWKPKDEPHHTVNPF